MKASGEIDHLLASLSREEKISLVGGADFWHTAAVERLGIPAVCLSDGPVGVRGERPVGTTSVSFPCGTAIGATFDAEAARRLAEALGDECLDRGVHVLLGPTVNLQRHPLGGRNFEFFSEDPVLSARLAVAYVRALQGCQVAATVKHFVANDTEFERHTISSDVSERVLRELYEVPFEAAVVDGGAFAVMASYNKVNGTFAAEHEGILNATLRGEWGFGGAVISDWFGTHGAVASALAGLDLEMPGPPLHYGASLARALEEGTVPEAVLDEHVRRVLTLALRSGALTGITGERPRAATTEEERRRLARELASSSFVLLKNEGAVLPFGLVPGQMLAVIGPNAAATSGQAGGSARVNPVGTRSVFQALRDRLVPLGIAVVHERGCLTWSGTPPLEAEFHLEYCAGTGFGSEDYDPAVRQRDTASGGSFTWIGSPGPPGSGLGDNWVVRASARLVPEEGGTWTFSLMQVGRARLLVDGTTVLEAGGEGSRGTGFFGLGSEEAFGTVELEAGRPYELLVEYAKQPGLPMAGLRVGALPPLPSAEELLRRAEALASKAEAVVCVVGTSPEWEGEGHDRVSMDLPGLQDRLVRHVVLANPRTCVLVNAGSPVTMDWTDDVAALAQIWLGGEQAGEGVADVLLGEADPGGRLPMTIPRRLEDAPAYPFYPGSDEHARYGEGLLVGYRHYDTRFVEPRFGFGEGLSYTTFALSDLQVSVVAPVPEGVLPPGLEGPALVVASLQVRNTGRRRGSEVVQCYVHSLDRRSDEPEQQLRAFEKVGLEPGESRRLELRLGARDFARFEEDRGGFVVAPGYYELRLGRSSRAISLTALVELSPGA